nr:MAG TPA_asm: hypothetical protein [Caudoviricetes sp.]
MCYRKEMDSMQSSNPDYSPKSGTYEHKRPILPLQE